MKLRTKILLSTILTSGLAACGGGGSGSSNAAGPIENIVTAGGVTTTTDIDVLSFDMFTFTLNPLTKTFTGEGDGEVFAGTFDPDTGVLTVPGTDQSITLTDFNVSVLDYTALSEDIGDGLTGAIATELTDVSALPTVNGVQYNGAFVSNVGTGTATTTVNFNSGSVDAEFGGLGGESAGASMSVTGMKLEDGVFQGGEVSVVTADGVEVNNIEDAGSAGTFYGPNGEELIGTLNVYDLDNGIDISGNWNGAQSN